MSQISLVGAGPGPLELLTLRALHRLEAAEVVVYDRLVGSEILARIPHGAARFDVGKRCGEPSPTQEEINALLLALAEQREVMLFDEWAADQDPQFRRIFYQVLLPRLKEMGKTVIAISHDDHYFSLADRLLEMRRGRLTELTGEQREQVSRDAVAHLDGKVPA